MATWRALAATNSGENGGGVTSAYQATVTAENDSRNLAYLEAW